MKKLITAMLHNRLLIGMITVFTLAFGILTLQSTKREDLPPVGLNTITITTIYPGASPEDVELNVTVPIERKLDGVAGIKKYTSTSTENVSVIVVKAEDSLNKSAMQKVLDDVKSAVDQAEDLPANIDGRPVIAEVDINKLPIIEIALFGDKKKLKSVAKNLELELRDLNGVATAEKVGYFDTEVHVEINPWMMQKYFVSFDEVIGSIRSRNIRASGGSINSYVGRKSIVTLSKFKSLHDVRRVILRSNFEQRKVMLSDVATIKVKDKDERLIVRSNGKQGISLVITKKPSADVITTIDNIKKYMAQRKLPKGVKYTLLNDTSVEALSSIDSLKLNGVIGVSLVFLVLMLFLNIRTAFWAAFAIPFSIIGTFALMPLVGLTLNQISLAGFLIVIGMLVSAAIVVSEHIETGMENGLDSTEAAIKGASEMVQPIAAATFTTIAAFLPMLFLGGTAGKFAVGVPIVVMLTLLVSLFQAIFLLPGYMAKSKPRKKAKAGWVIALENIYKKLLTVVLRHKAIFISSVILLLLGTLTFAALNMKFIMFSSSGSKKFYVKYEAPLGSSLQRTEKDVIKVEKVVLKMMKKYKNEIVSVSSRVGHNDQDGVKRNSGDHENWAVTTVYLTDPDKRKRSAKAIMRDLQNRVKNIKKTKLTFTVPKYGPSQEKPVQIVIMGNDPKKREPVVKKVLAFLKTIKGLSDIERDDKEGKKQLVIKLRYDKLAAYGLTTANIASLLRVAYDGHLVTSLQTVNEQIWYRVILAPRYRGIKEGIRYLKVRNFQGRLVPLSELVSFETISSKQDLYHYNGRQSVTVTAEVDNIKVTALDAARQVELKLLKNLQLPTGVSIKIAGEAAETKEIMGDFGVAMLMAVCAIFFIVALVLRHLSQTSFVIGLIPLGLIGVIWALYFHGMQFSFFSLLGFLGLIGIIVNDSIVMLDRLNSTIDKDNITIEAIVKSAATRLRPILMTTMTTVGGLIPGAYGIGGSKSFIVQLSITVAYGLLFCSMMTLFMVPVYYHIHGKKLKKKAEKKSIKKAIKSAKKMTDKNSAKKTVTSVKRRKK